LYLSLYYYLSNSLVTSHYFLLTIIRYYQLLCTFGIWPALARTVLLTAVAATTAEMNVVVLNLKFVGFDFWPWDAIEARILDVNDTSAIQADKVVMLPELGVEARSGARVAGLDHKAERNKRRQDTVHRHAGDLGQLAADCAVKLLSGRVVRPVQDCFKNGAPLRSDRQARFAVGREEAVHSLSFFYLTHLSEMSLYTR